MKLAPSLSRPASAALLVLGCLSFTSCGTTKTSARGGNGTSLNYDPPAHRAKNPGAVTVKISTGAQRLYVMEGSNVLLATPCTVGKPGTPTPAGNHRVTAKTFKRRSMSYGSYPMPYWVEFQPGYGMHWGFLKPYPCTHGCVRLPKKAAPKVFALVSPGTPISVASSQPLDSTVGARLPTLDDTSLPNPPDSYMMTDAVFQDAQYKGNLFVD